MLTKRTAAATLAALLTLFPSARGADPDAWVPFVIPWDDASPGPADVSFLLDPPAGGRGFVEARDGHFFMGDRRIRFWGVNVCFAACFPAPEDAPVVAARLAKSGINCVRFHHMDSSPFPRGIFRDRKLEDLSPEALDRLGRFIAELKRRGIYVNLNLHVSRWWSRAHGWPQAEELEDFDKMVDIFHPELIEAQKQYARDLLTHRNPHTGLRYIEDPAVAMVEITNEDSLFMWSAPRFLPEMPEPYASILAEKWNGWLRERYESDAKLRAAWAEGAAPLGASIIGDAPWKLEQHEGSAMRAIERRADDGPLLRIDIDKTTGTSWHLQVKRIGFKIEKGVPYTLRFRARADRAKTIGIGVTQEGEPWANLGLSASPRLDATWRPSRFGFTANAAESNARLSFSVGSDATAIEIADVELRAGGVEGLAAGESLAKANVALYPKDFAITRAREDARLRFLQDTERAYFTGMREFLKRDLGLRALVTGTIAFGPLGTAVQAEMDFVDQHAYWQHPHFPNRPWDSRDWIVRNTPMSADPRGGTLPHLASTRVAGKPYTVTEYNHPAPLDSQAETVPIIASFAALQDWDGVFLFTYSHSDEWRRDRIHGFFDIDANPSKWGFMGAGALIFSGTRLEPAGTLRREKGRYIAYGRAAAVACGALAGQPVDLRHVRIHVASPASASIAIASRDGNPIDQAREVQIVACGRCENTAMGWNADRSSVGDRWGSSPVRIEPVDATIEIATKAADLRVHALDPLGQPAAEIPVERIAGGFRFAIGGAAASLWYTIQGTPPAISILSIRTDPAPGPGATHGLRKIREALAGAPGQIEIVAGLARSEGEAARLLEDEGIAPPEGNEALVIQRIEREGEQVLLVAGSDDRGLMYAALDVADGIGRAKDPRRPLSEVREAREKPFVSDRAISKYTFHRKTFERCFFDEAYWARYLDMLAANRFNRFVLIFGYENWGYFSPPYPYFFDVEGYPDVRVVEFTKEDQLKYSLALRRLIEMVHARGLEFTIGIWDHIYRGGVQGPTELSKKPTPGIVWGLTEKNLVAFTQAALAKFVKEFPGIDSVQFRMHGESGLRGAEMRSFWESIYRVMKESAPGMRFDARAKEFPDELIDLAIEMDVPIRITTKYWMEQMGLPFHPTHVNPQNQRDRRHGYADLLRYPKRYPMHWRLWNGGTSRVLLWGDPEYVRRFAGSTHLYDGEGFEVNEPLATKMQDQPHDLDTFEVLNPKYRWYDFEFERYWHFFQVWGRVSYDPETPPEVWRREFERRFGEAAAPHIERALHRASRILPRIAAYNYPYDLFPMTRGWVEKQRMEDLPAYARALPSDTEQFLSFADAARIRMEGGESAKISPGQSSLWFAQAANDVEREVALAEEKIGDRASPEFLTTVADLRILTALASYHAVRALAGLEYATFLRSRDIGYLERAIGWEKQAANAWGAIVRAAGDVYVRDLAFGRRSAGLCGHWGEELNALLAGIEKLERERASFVPEAPSRAREPAPPPDDREPPILAHQPIRRAAASKPLAIEAMVRDPSGVMWVRIRYRSVTQFEEYRTIEMVPAGEKDRYAAIVPAEALDPKWDFLYFFEVMDAQGNGKIYPDLEKETPYVVVELER